MARKIKRVVEYYADDSELGEITQTKSITSVGNDLGIDPSAKPPVITNLWEFPEDKRGAIRYAIDMDVAVLRNGVSFRTKTINVSTTGALFLDNIPAVLVNQLFEMLLTYKETINGHTVQHVFPVVAKALGAPFRTPRVQFVNISVPIKSKLDSLLKNFKPV